jgi:hypothetical protein
LWLPRVNGHAAATAQAQRRDCKQDAEERPGVQGLPVKGSQHLKTGAVSLCKSKRGLRAKIHSGVIVKGSNQVRDPEQKRRKNAEGRKNGEAVS